MRKELKIFTRIENGKMSTYVEKTNISSQEEMNAILDKLKTQATNRKTRAIRIRYDKRDVPKKFNILDAIDGDNDNELKFFEDDDGGV